MSTAFLTVVVIVGCIFIIGVIGAICIVTGGVLIEKYYNK